MRFHKSFSHPATDKPLDLLKFARTLEIYELTKEILVEIAKKCDICQHFGPPPVRIKVAPSTEEDDLIFCNKELLYLMWLDGRVVLHILDSGTRCNAATFLDSHGQTYGQPVDGIWPSFIVTWVTMYTGYPNKLR